MREEVKMVTGNFFMEILHSETGEKLSSFEEKNLVVMLGHGNLAKLLGGSSTGKQIDKIALGTNGNSPTLNDTAITGMFSKNIQSVSYPGNNSVMFNWAINADEANGITIKEFGLLNQDGVLCARKVRTDIVKTSSVRLVGSWTITFN